MSQEVGGKVIQSTFFTDPVISLSGIYPGEVKTHFHQKLVQECFKPSLVIDQN